MKREQLFIRDLDAWVYLEIFLVAAVTALLGIRLLLELTSYPQLGGQGLHIAHMLWGGLLMLAAIIILLAFLSKASRRLAALVGGLGFGTFIDEIGKFVTSDNNYFFDPAVALIYGIFIATFLTIHAIHIPRHSESEYLMNVLQELEEVALHDLTEEEEARLRLYLEECDPEHPMIPALKEVVSQAALVPAHPASPWTRAKAFLRESYRRIARLPGFPVAVIAFFVVKLVIGITYGFALVFLYGLGWEGVQDMLVLGGVAEKLQALTFVDTVQLVSSFLAAILILLGVFRIRSSRLAAFEMFERSVLVSIFLTQVFSFYREQFSALLGLLVNVLILIAVRFVMEEERWTEAGEIGPGSSVTAAIRSGI